MHKALFAASKLALFAMLLLVFAWCAAAARIVLFSRHSSDGPADAALVLGAAAWGNRPSPVYRERILRAIDLYDQHRVRWIVLTGGSPLLGYPAEAQVGRRYCLLHGIPSEALVIEDQSRTTWTNLDYARPLMDQVHIRTVLLVSDPLHMKRAVAMARVLGIDAQPAPTSTSRFRSWRTRSVLLWHEAWSYLGFALFDLRD